MKQLVVVVDFEETNEMIEELIAHALNLKVADGVEVSFNYANDSDDSNIVDNPKGA